MDAKQRCEIKVDGQAEVLLAPERAILKIQARTTRTEKQKSTSSTIESARKIEALIRELSSKIDTDKLPAIDYWSRTSLAEHSNTPYRDGKNQPTEYTAQIDFRIQLQTFRKLGSLIQHLVAIENTSSLGVEWVLTPETKAAQRAKLRTMAVKDAVAQAKDYATALDYANVYPFEIIGAKQYTHSSSMKGRTISREIPSQTDSTQSKNMAEADDWEDVADEAFDYSPEDIKMTQTINAKFIAE